MRVRLYNYVFGPNRARRIADRAVLAVAIAFSCYSVLSGDSGIDAVKSGLAIAFVGIVTTTAWNVIFAEPSDSLRHKAEHRPVPLMGRRSLVASGFAAAAVILGAFEKRLEAEILDRRLRRFATRTSITERDIKNVTNALDIAQKDRIKVSTTAVSDAAAKAFERLGSDDGRMRGLPDLSPILRNLARSAAATQSMIHDEVAPSYRRVLKSIPDWSVYEQCYVSGLKISLDTKAFLGTLVTNCTVSYDGGAVIIENTEFVSCDFVFSSSDAANRLLFLLTQRSDPDFQYDAEEIMSRFPRLQERLKAFHQRH